MAESAQSESDQRARDKIQLTKEEVAQLIAGVKTATSKWESQPHEYSVSG